MATFNESLSSMKKNVNKEFSHIIKAIDDCRRQLNTIHRQVERLKHVSDTNISMVEKAAMSSIHELESELNVMRSLNDDGENEMFETMSLPEHQELCCSETIPESPLMSSTPKGAIPGVIEIDDSPPTASCSPILLPDDHTDTDDSQETSML
eukprot:Seg3357.1 transcript_id=Seg3357.1/GoldUCD/mRNA.D3Y31 product="hypothetical protein" protein_id=Seg3357.1/GoldUCD/D3Y31